MISNSWSNVCQIIASICEYTLQTILVKLKLNIKCDNKIWLDKQTSEIIVWYIECCKHLYSHTCINEQTQSLK